MVEQRAPEVEGSNGGPNTTTWVLIGALLLILAFGVYLSTRGGGDQDKLTNPQVASRDAEGKDKVCASKSTYDLIKRDLFRRAAQLRGNDEAEYDQLAAAAALRVENPVMESENGTTAAVNCSATLSLDLPPGVAVIGGRRTLSSDVDYTVQPAADGSGQVVLLRNADAIVTPLAALTRTSAPAPAAVPDERNQVAPPAVTPEPAVPVASQPAQQSTIARPSFNCANARTRGERAVCSDGGLAALDTNMAAQYRRALASAAPDERQLLQSTRDRFLRYRDRCGDRQCIADAYVGRMREIRDIAAGNWQPPR